MIRANDGVPEFAYFSHGASAGNVFRFGQFPESGKTRAVGGDLPQQNRPVAADDEQSSCDISGPRRCAFDGQFVLESESARRAPLCNGAFGATRAPGKTDGCAQFHHGLIKIAGPPAVEQWLRHRAQTRSCFGVPQLALVGSHASEHSQNVAIHRRPRLAKCDAGDGSGRVRSNTRQLADRILILRIRACFSNPSGGRLQIARSRIISKPRPTGQKLALGRAREGLGHRIMLQKSVVIRKHGGDARLLEHNL